MSSTVALHTRLGEFVAGLTLEALPPKVVEKVRVNLLHDLSVAMAAHDVALPVWGMVAELGPEEATLLCSGDRGPAEMVAFARDWSFGPFLKHTQPGATQWWYGLTGSNWNTVCSGGAGMLALAMQEEAPEAHGFFDYPEDRLDRLLAQFVQGLAHGSFQTVRHDLLGGRLRTGRGRLRLR